MNFVDTAITLLQEFGKPMAVDELCKMAMDRGLLDKPGANPLRSMKTRLTVELKKGNASRVQKTDDEAWRLCDVEVSKAAKKKAPAKTSKAKSAAKAPAKAKAGAKPATKAKAKAKAGEKTSEKATSAAKSKAKPKSKQAATKAAPKESTRKRRSSKKDVAAATPEPEAHEVVEPPVVLTAEEQALVDLYGDNSSGTRSAAELNEYQDELTKDEDRLMLPEIKAERKPFRRDRERERPRQRRTRRGREGRDGGREVRDGGREVRPSAGAENRNGAARPAQARVSGNRDISGEPISVVSAPGIAKERVTRSALQVLSALPAGQSMPVRQLTQTMISRQLLEGQADQLWRMVKGTLLVSEQRRITRGLKPLVRYHGKDLFSATPEAGRSIVNVASIALQAAAENYAAAVEDETLERLAKLAPAMLERIAYVYLQTTGWSDIQWIKRVENSSYALATEPGAVEETMISVRSGPSKVDRRGVGELRAGLHAKGISSGLLISPCEMSDEADLELAKDGAPLRIVCGSDFAAELVSREVGVTWRQIQLPQIDQRFYDAVLS